MSLLFGLCLVRRRVHYKCSLYPAALFSLAVRFRLCAFLQTSTCNTDWLHTQPNKAAGTAGVLVSLIREGNTPEYSISRHPSTSKVARHGTRQKQKIKRSNPRGLFLFFIWVMLHSWPLFADPLGTLPAAAHKTVNVDAVSRLMVVKNCSGEKVDLIPSVFGVDPNLHLF